MQKVIYPMTQPSTLMPLGNAASLVQHIARSVSRGDLQPDERLPSERDLSEEHGISRQSVRKAIRALSEAGIIRVESGRGAASGSYIDSNLVPYDLIDPTRKPPSFSDVARVLEARRLIEPSVALFAGMRMDDRDYDNISEVLEMQKNATDLDVIRGLDSRFHLAIADATHNDVVTKQMERLMRELEIARHVIPTRSADQEVFETIDVHEQTLAAISSRDPERIAETMDMHLSMMEQAWEHKSGRKLSVQAMQIRCIVREID